MRELFITYGVIFIGALIFGVIEFKKSGVNSGSLLPWYVMLWNLIWFPFFIVAKTVLCLIILMMRGPETAFELWKELR